MPRLSVTLQDHSGHSTVLIYEIYQHDLAHRWLSLTRKSLAEPYQLRQTFHNRTQLDLPACQQSLLSVARDINLLRPDLLAGWINEATVDQSLLNYLHVAFERFAQAESQGLPHQGQLSELFHQLNTQIHIYESARSIRPGGPGSFNLLYDMAPRSGRCETQPWDLQWLEPNLSWGGLYLGYNTIGKDWLSCYLDDDRDLIRHQAVTPQRQFSTETFLCFSTGTPWHTRVLDFQRWYLGLPPALQAQVPMDNLSELSLGKFRIGELIIDQQFLDLDPDPWHWQAQGHPCRQLWNHVVFRSLRSIKEIKILT